MAQTSRATSLSPVSRRGVLGRYRERRHSGEAQKESRTGAGPVLGAHLTTVREGDAARDRQPQSHTPWPVPAAPLDAEVPFEYARQSIGWYTCSRIVDQ